MILRRNLLAALLAWPILLASHAHAQDWPSRTVTIVVPFPAGSATDQLARVLGEQMQRDLGKPVVVENRPGANGTIGTAAAAKATDGHTLLMATSTTHAANASLYRRLPYDPIKDFVPIGRVAQIPFVMLVNPQVPAKTIQEFVAYAKANPGKLGWGSGSSGSLIPGNTLVTYHKLDMNHAQYRGVQPAVVDMIGGTIQMAFADLATAAPQVQAGKARALAVTSATPHPTMPGVPPMSVSVPGFEMTAWFGLYGVAGMDTKVVDRVNRSLNAAMARREVQQKLAPLGFEFTPSTPDDLGLFAAKETVKWAKAVIQAGIKPE
jgi:tripartite-type tricarboxylate transporter receptor subunit TctC